MTRTYLLSYPTSSRDVLINVYQWTLERKGALICGLCQFLSVNIFITNFQSEPTNLTSLIMELEEMGTLGSHELVQAPPPSTLFYEPIVIPIQQMRKLSQKFYNLCKITW